MKRYFMLLASILVLTNTTIAADRFGGQAGASIGSVIIRFGSTMTIPAMAYSVSGNGFYEIAPTHKIGGTVSASYLSLFSQLADEYIDDDDKYVRIDWSGAYLNFIFAPTYRFEPQPNVYVQAALNIDAEIMYTGKLTGESRTYEFFQEDRVGYDPLYIAELSARYHFVGASYAFIVNDDVLSRNIIGASLYAPITDRIELMPSISYRFGKESYRKLDFTIGVNYLF